MASLPPGTKRAGERGQISIFLAASMIVLISIIAFVINIGLFVKAKINLQNAVDAAAYAGAGVQARMLNRIGYLNWEMRNVYKEWMFKYYVLGNLNINGVMNPDDEVMDFTMEKDPNLSEALGGRDIYNFPSVCLHYAGVPTNVCKKYAIPGIPRFEPTNLVGIDETTSAFIDAIVRQKADDCSKRTQLNYAVTTMWAYQVLEQGELNAFADAPQVAPDRPGAWPQAVELGIRVRSLERAVNRPPLAGGVCARQGDAAGACSTTIDQLGAERHYGNERAVKAFWSAYRNLGNEQDSEMKQSFTLTELTPQGVQYGNPKDMSYQLMDPAKAQEPKHYLDLKLMSVNLSTFFTALITRTSSLNAAGEVVSAEGACDVAKIGIPIPGYPLGFYKNPEVLTYYAVKGEAKFNGLFNPFSNYVKLSAWAAAKPMGGRIGPALFNAQEGAVVKTRVTTENYRSNGYISGLNLLNLPKKGGGVVPVGDYAPGIPLPFNSGASLVERFWINDSGDQVGGWLDGQNVVFGIPNLVYDLPEGGATEPSRVSNQGSPTNVITTGAATGYASGLFLGEQFRAFRRNLVGTSDVAEVSDSIMQARAPTLYDVANYTVPSPTDMHLSQKVDGASLDNFGFVAAPPSPSMTNQFERRMFSFHAPLYGDTGDAMYSSAPAVVGAMEEFINNQQGSMRKYLTALNIVAKRIYEEDPSKYADAARRISDFDFSADPTTAVPQSCSSIAGQFAWFYFKGVVASPTGCPKPLLDSLTDYYGKMGPQKGRSYDMEFIFPSKHWQEESYDFRRLLTGYFPGPQRGASITGVMTTPFPAGPPSESMRRSGYSAKFIALHSVTQQTGYDFRGSSVLTPYSEGKMTPWTEDFRPAPVRNVLGVTGGGLPPSVNH